MSSMRHLAAAVLGTVLSVGVTSAVASRCAPQIHVRTMPVQVVEHHDLGLRQVTQVNQSSHHARTRDGVGLGSLVTEYRVNGQMRTDARGCPVMRLEVGYPVMHLYVARELLDDRCAFEHVRRHELEHVAINERWLKVVPGRIQRRLAREHTQLLGVPDRDLRLKLLLDSALAELKQVQHYHDGFDSPEEYATNSTACGGSIQQLLDRVWQESDAEGTPGG